MKIRRAFKVRRYPHLTQAILLNKPFGCCCFLYNLMLAESIETDRTLQDDKQGLHVDAAALQHAFASRHGAADL